MPGHRAEHKHALARAIREGRQDEVRRLLHEFPSLKTSKIVSQTWGGPLFLAAGLSVPMTALLIEEGVPVGTLNKLGRTCLFSAGTPEMVNLLCDAGVDVNVTDCRGYSAIRVAFKNRSRPVFMALYNRGARCIDFLRGSVPSDRKYRSIIVARIMEDTEGIRSFPTDDQFRYLLGVKPQEVIELYKRGMTQGCEAKRPKIKALIRGECTRVVSEVLPAYLPEVANLVSEFYC